MKWIKELQDLARSLPTGLNDPNILRKLAAERIEQAQAESIVDSCLEGGDRVYYAAKAVFNEFITPRAAFDELRDAARVARVRREIIVAIAIEKYRLRAQPGNPKNREREQKTAQRIFDAAQPGTVREKASRFGARWQDAFNAQIFYRLPDSGEPGGHYWTKYDPQNRMFWGWTMSTRAYPPMSAVLL